MKPYYEEDGITIYHGDCMEIIPSLPACDLVLTDPPYFRVKGDWWDRQWDSADGFAAWIGDLCDKWRECLKANGSLMLFASPQMSWRVEGEVRQRFNVLNAIRWQKSAGWHNKAEIESLRSWRTPWESIIFAEKFGCDDSARTDYSEAERVPHKDVYSVIGRVIAARRTAAGLARHEVDTACSPSRKPTGLCYRWEEGACLPTLHQFVDFCRLCGDTSSYEELRTQYEELRTQYEELRRPFFLDSKIPKVDIWDYDAVKPFTAKHPCEKPLLMIADMVRCTTRVDATVLDCFMGAGTTIMAAKNLKRKAIGIEIEERYCEITAKRLSQGALEFTEEAVPA